MRRAAFVFTLIAPLLLRAELPPFVEKLAPNVWAGGWGAKEQAVNVVWYVSGGKTYLIGDHASVDTAAIAALTGKPVEPSRTSQPGVDVIAPGVYFLKPSRILFAGDLVTNGPRSAIQPNLFAWLAQLDRLSALQPLKVVPGKGSWTGPNAIDRQRRFVREIFRQVAYGIAMERPLASIQSELLIPASHLVWMPYDTPSPGDVADVYRQLTAPVAPIWPATPAPGKKQALVLIGDRFHEPEHFLDTLRPVIESTGVETHFIVDYRALTRENLARVDLLIILRDGMVWPAGPQGPQRIWMTPEQEQAVEDFVVKDGKAFLNLHNSMGIYPEGGKYLRLVGGRYIGHGPLERYHVEVSDPTHPIAQGVTNWFAADEQHTPPADIPVKVFLTNRSPDGKVKAHAGWTHEPGKGRVCHFAPGHTRESLLHPMFQRTLRNAIEWCLRRR